MTWETIFPQTARALSAPLTKLIQVVSAGCGTLYQPTHIRRLARAHADAITIAEEANAERNQIAMRALDRMSHIEGRRQKNIESIVREAVEYLPEQVSEQAVSEDWATRFFTECADIGDKEMQSAWAQLLAGEVGKPGTFSRRTLSVLKNLSVEEAQLFNTVCALAFHDERHAAFYPMVFWDDEAFWKSQGFGFTDWYRLVDAGLINYHSKGLVLETERCVFRTPETLLLVRLDDGDRAQKKREALQIGGIDFTPAGDELAIVCEWRPPIDRLRALAARIKPPFKATTVPATATFYDPQRPRRKAPKEK